MSDAEQTRRKQTRKLEYDMQPGRCCVDVSWIEADMELCTLCMQVCMHSRKEWHQSSRSVSPSTRRVIWLSHSLLSPTRRANSLVT